MICSRELRNCFGAGETEEQFQRTVQLVQEVGFDRVNTAAYSPRPNTPAAEAAEQVWTHSGPSCELTFNTLNCMSS